jgi:hypothetical protein
VATTTGQYYYKCLPTTPSPQARDDRSALLLWQRVAVLAGMKENGAPPLWLRGESSRPHFEPDADLSGIIFGEMNASLLESFLYFDDSRELSFLNAFVSFNALQGRQA